MKRLSLIGLLFVLFASLSSIAAPIDLNGLYVNSYGNSTNQALIYVHGGPGYSSQDFELSTAQVLADKGYFVIVYDQRGQGRSKVAQDPKDYTYQKYSDDINAIIQHYGLIKPVLMGHSHGGPISLKFDQMNPGVAGKIVLISAPVNFWKSMDSIQSNCTERYQKSGNATDLAKLQAAFATLNKIDSSIEDQIYAVAAVFGLGVAKECALYSTSFPTSEAKALRAIIAKNQVAVVQENLFYPMPNFLINEYYIRVDQSDWVRKNADHIFGIYGEEDGLFTSETLADIQLMLAKNKSQHRFQLLKNASHGLFVDQQNEFISALKRAIEN